MFTEIFHTEVRCRPDRVMLHVVRTFDGERWWEFAINPRVTTPWRKRVVAANAERYVASRAV